VQAVSRPRQHHGLPVTAWVPRGYPADHPRAGLLRHRSLIAARELESGAVRDAGPVYRACERLRPLLGWLAGHAVVAPQGARVAAGPR
jgi:hypothetical protein